MPAPVSVRDDLCRLVALSPGDGRIAGLVRQVCARALSLPSLPCEVAVNEPESPAEAVVAEFAEQFSVDVSAITGEQRSLLWTHLGEDAFGAVVAMYIADFVPRVRAGLEALGVGKEYLGWVTGPISWDHNTDLSAAVFNGFLPAVARMRALDPVTSELVRLRGAAQHNCRVCKVVAAEGGACAVAQAAGGDPVVFGVDRDDPPAVAVAHRIVGRKILSLDAVADIAGAFTYRDVDGLACRRHHHPPVVVRGDVANDNRKSRCRLDHSSDVSSMQRWSQARRRSVLRRAATTRRASRNCSQITSGSSSASMSIALSASASYWRCRRASR